MVQRKVCVTYFKRAPGWPRRRPSLAAEMKQRWLFGIGTLSNLFHLLSRFPCFIKLTIFLKSYITPPQRKIFICIWNNYFGTSVASWKEGMVSVVFLVLLSSPGFDWMKEDEKQTLEKIQSEPCRKFWSSFLSLRWVTVWIFRRASCLLNVTVRILVSHLNQGKVKTFIDWPRRAISTNLFISFLKSDFSFSEVNVFQTFTRFSS